MNYYETETTTESDGSVRLASPPFPPGTRVRVMVVNVDAAAATDAPVANVKLPIEEAQRLLAGTVVSEGDLLAPAYTDDEMEAFAMEPIMPNDHEVTYPLRGTRYRIADGAFDGPVLDTDEWEASRDDS